MVPRNPVYGLALYQPEVELPFKARRPETQSVAEDMATWLKAQSALVLEGDVSRRESEAQPEAPKAGGNQGEVAHSGKSQGLTFRARQLREAPRLTKDVTELSRAVAQLPGPPTGRRISCEKSVDRPPEEVAPPKPRKPRAAKRPRPSQAAGSAGGWYTAIPRAAQRIRALREAAEKAGELPEVLKVFESKASRHQVWSGNESPPARKALPHGAEKMQTLQLTITLPEVQQFEEEKMPDRVSNLAKQLRIPLDTLKQAYETFWEICNTLDHPMAARGKRTNKKGDIIDDDVDVFQDGEVNIDGFAKLLCKLVGCSTTAELPDGLVHRSFRDADGNGTKSVSFLEFAFWYSRHGFMENMLLTSAQLEVRQLARKYDLPVIEVEQYKKKFDLFDEDQSGLIDYEEFQKLLSSLIKVPANLDLPATRVNQFWAEADRDRSQSISFEEFLLFFYRYFSINAPTVCPFQEYYRGIRRVKVAYPASEGKNGTTPGIGPLLTTARGNQSQVTEGRKGRHNF